MQQMKDIGDEELNQIQKKVNSRRPVSNQNEIPDEQLINMVQKIQEGKMPLNLVEPDKPKDIPAFSSDNNANYWKITGLPSKCKFYPAGTEIYGRPLKVLEVKKISSLNDENGDFVLNDVVRNTIKGINFDELYVADKLFIIFWLRANSYRESGYVVPFICNRCKKKSDYHFEVNNLEVQEISDGFDPKNDIKISKGDVITYDYLRIKDELFIDRFKELNREALGDIDSDILSMAQMLKTINGKEQTLLQKYHWIVNLSPGDYSYLKTLIEKKGMGIRPFISVTCKECGGTALVAVSFREEFFIPEFKFE